MHHSTTLASSPRLTCPPRPQRTLGNSAATLRRRDRLPTFVFLAPVFFVFIVLFVHIGHVGGECSVVVDCVTPLNKRSTALSPRSNYPREKAVPVIGPVTEAWSSPRHKEITRVEQEVRSKSAATYRYLEARKHQAAEGRSLSCRHITSSF